MRLLASLSVLLIASLAAQLATVETAWNLVAGGKRDEAVAVLRQVIAANPQNPEARLLLGSILAESGKAAEAIVQLREAVKLAPRSAEAHHALGEARNGAGDLKGAREAFEKAINLDPKFAQARVNLGSLLSQAGEWRAAAEHLDRALALLGATPDAAYALYLRAKVYSEAGEAAKAADVLQKAVTLQPDFGEAWSDLGQAKKTLLDEAGALAAFQRSVQIDPENAVSQYRLGAQYLKLGKPHEAVEHLQRSYRLNPANQSTLNSLQLALRQDGQLEEARNVRAKLAELLRNIDKESQAAFTALQLNNQGAALEKSGNLPGAAEKYREAATVRPDHAGYRLNHGIALLRFGQWKEGLAELREALRLDPGNARMKVALDDALKQAPVEFGGKGIRVEKSK